MKIALTGATGFLGNVIARTAIEKGHILKILIRNESESIKDLVCERVKGDILDKSSIQKLVKGADALIHSAGIISIDGDPDGRIAKVNVNGAELIARVCLDAGIGRMVHISTVHAFDETQVMLELNENCPLVEKGFAYQVSKAQGLKRILKLQEQGLNVISLHPTGLIGPYDFGPSRVGKMIEDLILRRMPGLVKGGYDFVDVRDVAGASIEAVQKGESGEKILLPGRFFEIRELAGLICKAANVKPPKMVMPIWVAKMSLPLIKLISSIKGASPSFTKESLEILKFRVKISGEKAARILGYSPRSFEITIDESVQWMQKRINDRTR